MTEPKIILDQDGIRRALTRIAFEIVEKNKGAEHLLLAGVKTRGIYLAQRIAAKLGEVEGKAPPVLELDVTPWRDDVPRTDAPLPDLDPRIAGATVIIVDDMIASGESMLDVTRQLKDRGAERVFVCTTFGLFTEGLDKFDEYYEKGYLDRLITTNLTYLPPQLHDKPYFIEADMSKFLALIIDSMNHSTSISAVMNPTDKIHDLLAKRNMR